MNAAVETAHSIGRPVAVHSRRPGRQAIMAGVDTIEHGDGGTRRVQTDGRRASRCPTLAAGDATANAAAGTRPAAPEPAGITLASFKAALAAGVTIASGSDVGVFTQGQCPRDRTHGRLRHALIDALKSATSVDAKALKMDADRTRHTGAVRGSHRGRRRSDEGISTLHKVTFVMKGGCVGGDGERLKAVALCDAPVDAPDLRRDVVAAGRECRQRAWRGRAARAQRCYGRPTAARRGRS
jgi:hypothetical protein